MQFYSKHLSGSYSHDVVVLIVIVANERLPMIPQELPGGKYLEIAFPEVAH
jgi:hypothetical protein